ncbi:MAG: type III-B CRISPR module RAMP protein Cmr6 [Candidatus Aenigmarchaeota archaeon]|nr:type III-B CRISPR module RAMP protein Cmr6 [Candidatus Aenigmarchaeota archaeon]
MSNLLLLLSGKSDQAEISKLVTPKLKQADIKKKVINSLKEFQSDQQNISKINNLLVQLNQKFEDILDDYSKTQQVPVLKLTLTLSSKLVVGLGISSVLEVFLRLHSVYGFPIIPSSALKGVLRAYKFWELSEWNLELLKVFEFLLYSVYEKCENPGKELLSKVKSTNEDIISKNIDFINEKIEEFLKVLSIFGSQKHKGSLVVLDAIPDKFCKLQMDILNCHYPEYYQNNTPPGDWQNPVPVSFFVIPKGTRFNFYFINAYPGLREDVINALSILGIGAKTALNYGTLVV